jgi:hypothetical protein
MSVSIDSTQTTNNLQPSQATTITTTSTTNNTVQHTSKIQQTISPHFNNLPLGGLLLPKDSNSIQLYFMNLQSKQLANNWQALHTSCKQIKAATIDIASLAETNIKWDLRRRNQTSQTFKKYLSQSILSTSLYSESCRTSYQLGCTLTGHHWQIHWKSNKQYQQQ